MNITEEWIENYLYTMIFGLGVLIGLKYLFTYVFFSLGFLIIVQFFTDILIILLFVFISIALKTINHDKKNDNKNE